MCNGPDDVTHGPEPNPPAPFPTREGEEFSLPSPLRGGVVQDVLNHYKDLTNGFSSSIRCFLNSLLCLFSIRMLLPNVKPALGTESFSRKFETCPDFEWIPVNDLLYTLKVAKCGGGGNCSIFCVKTLY